MDLRELIPAVESIAGPLSAILGDGSSGLSGLSSRVEGQDFGGIASGMGSSLQGTFDRALPPAGGGPSTGAANALGGLSARVGTMPTDLLSGVQEPLSDLGSLVARVPELVGIFSQAASAVEDARGGNLAPIVALAGTALSGVAQSTTGSDFAEFSDWTRYVAELADLVRPIVAAGGTPDSLREALLTLALDRARETILGLAPNITQALADVGTVVGGTLSDVPALGLSALRDEALESLGGVRRVATEAGDVEAEIGTYRTRLFTLIDRLNVALDQAESRFNHPLLTPGGVTALASAEIDRVLATQVSDFSNVHERLRAFYDAIEGALERVDLSAITAEITAFFGTIEGAVSGIDFGVVGRELDSISAEADRLVDRFESALTQVTARLQQWLGNLEGELTSLLNTLGSFDAEGRFRFTFQNDIDALFERTDALIQGHPTRPDEPSVRGALSAIETNLLDFIHQITGSLESLIAELESAKNEVAGLLDGVRSELESVNPTEVMTQAKAALEQAFHEIGDLEFDPIVDPVVRELEEARDALARIDVSELNELLRAALREALNAIATSDFDRQLTRPLLREFDELLKEPRALLASFGDKVNELIRRIEAISPAALLEPLQRELDKIKSGLDVDLEALLGPPLEQALSGLRGLLARLDPAPLLEPIAQAFDQAIGVVDGLQPARLLEPADVQMKALGGLIRGIDLDQPLASVNAVFGDIERFLDEIEPTRLLRPLNEPFEQARQVLEGLRPSVLLAPLSDLMGQLGDLTGSVPESVAVQARALYDQAIARVDSLDPSRAFEPVRSGVGALRGRLENLALPAILHALQTEYTATRSALAVADAEHGTSFATAFAAVEPTRVFGETVLRYERASTRLRGVLDGIAPASLQTRYQEARARVEELLPRAIRSDITTSQIQILLDLTDPTRLITLLNSTYQRILDQLLSINPTLLAGPLVALHQGLRTLLAGIDVRAVTARVEGLLGRFAGLIENLSLSELASPVLEMVERLKSVLRALDPAPIISGLHDRFENLLALFDEISVRAVLRALQQGWDAVRERIDSLLDLKELFEPLVAIAEQIQALIGGLDMGELVGVIDDKLDKLRDELEEALNRTGDAFKAMLAAAPL